MNIIEKPISELIQLSSPFDFSYGPLPKGMKNSIGKMGVINMPQIYEGEETILITGKRRLKMVYELNPHQRLHIKIFKKNELSEEKAFQIHLFDNLSTRSLNPMEKSNVLKILKSHFNLNPETLQKEYLPYLELPLKEEILADYLKLQNLSSKAKEGVAAQILQVDTAVKILKFPSKDQEILLTLIETLHLGIHPQKNLITYAWEISQKKKLFISEWIKREVIQDILKKEEWSSAQKWAKLESELRRERYPLLKSLESHFAEIKKDLHLPPALTLQHPPYFETNDYLLQWRFKNEAQYRSGLQLLNKIESTKSFHGLFELTEENGQTILS
ncbi:MAG: hypothetical protein HYZ67_03750 [Chlamydiae bacterium]|nr:hypothetical protein [Chlamydiota bacterium]